MTLARRAATPLLLSLITLVAGCRGFRPGVSLAAADRARIYAAVLQEVRRDTAARWVVLDSLVPTTDIDAEQHDKVITELPITRDALDAFLRVQRNPAERFQSGMIPDARWIAVSMPRLDSLRAAARADASLAPIPDGPRPDRFWQQWYRAFPGSAGYVVLSPASISHRGDEAVVHVRIACGPVCGETELRVLQRDDQGLWHTTRKVRLSES